MTKNAEPEGKTLFIEIAGALADVIEAQDALDAKVAEARKQGTSWALIGTALGLTKQGAQQRYTDRGRRRGDLMDVSKPKRQ